MDNFIWSDWLALTRGTTTRTQSGTQRVRVRRTVARNLELLRMTVRLRVCELAQSDL